MIGLGEKKYSESADMTCGLLCCLCSSVGRTVTDFLSRGFSHELNPLETILWFSAFQGSLALETVQRAFILPDLVHSILSK